MLRLKSWGKVTGKGAHHGCICFCPFGAVAIAKDMARTTTGNYCVRPFAPPALTLECSLRSTGVGLVFYFTLDD